MKLRKALPNETVDVELELVLGPVAVAAALNGDWPLCVVSAVWAFIAMISNVSRGRYSGRRLI